MEGATVPAGESPPPAALASASLRLPALVSELELWAVLSDLPPIHGPSATCNCRSSSCNACETEVTPDDVVVACDTITEDELDDPTLAAAIDVSECCNKNRLT